MVYCNFYHSLDIAVVEDFESVELEASEGPCITSPEEDVDGGGSDIEAVADVEGYFGIVLLLCLETILLMVKQIASQILTFE